MIHWDHDGDLNDQDYDEEYITVGRDADYDLDSDIEKISIAAT